MNLFISPHNDDAVLFGAFTLIREKPLVLVVTDSLIQWNRGEKVTADERWEEDVKAMKYLGCPIVRGGIEDDKITELAVRELLSRFENFDTVYAPALQGGNPHHDLISNIVADVFKNIYRGKYYTTYTKTELYTTGLEEVVPTTEELKIKQNALSFYKSQIRINGPHFDAVTKGGSEWFI